jgi:hypothetical protein
MPVHDLRQAVEILVELPDQPRLADPGDAGDRDQVRLLLVGADVEDVLDLAQLAVASDERGLQALGLQRAAGAGDDPHRVPELMQPVLPFSSNVPADS